MKFRMLTALLSMLAIAPCWAQAQIKLPIYEEEPGSLKNVVFQEAKERGDFRNGKMMRVTLTNDKTVKGILVRVDPAKSRIYLRTEPGMPPVAIAEKDVKKIDKGVIKQVGYNQDYAAPEIQTVVIANGAKQSVSYYAPTLSPGEKAQLVEIENAENEIARLDHLAATQEQLSATDVTIQAEQLKSQALMNNFLWKRELPGGYANSLNSGMTYGNFGYNMVPLSNGVPGTADGDTMSSTFKSFSYPTNPLPFLRYGPSAFTSATVSPEALTKARQQLATMQNRSVFENGRLVAVILPDQEK